jgi:hypothetical protein
VSLIHTGWEEGYDKIILLMQISFVQSYSCCYNFHQQRLFNNEYMTAVYTGSTQYVTALTLALLEDSGWYLPNYAVAQNNPFALGAGCDFVHSPCIQDGKVPSWGEGIFCNSASSIGCTPDKELVAYCDISKWDANLPSGYQYFDESVSSAPLHSTSLFTSS